MVFKLHSHMANLLDRTPNVFNRFTVSLYRDRVSYNAHMPRDMQHTAHGIRVEPNGFRQLPHS